MSQYKKFDDPVNVTTNTPLQRALDLMATDIQHRERRIAELKADILRRESEEASVCPEDVGVVEHVGALNRRIAELEAALKRYGWHDTNDGCDRIEWTEDGNILYHQMNRCSCGWDDSMANPTLDAALAGAKREALESAADKLSDPQWAVVQRVIRRMAREVQLNNVQRTPDSSQEVKS